MCLSYAAVLLTILSIDQQESCQHVRFRGVAAVGWEWLSKVISLFDGHGSEEAALTLTSPVLARSISSLLIAGRRGGPRIENIDHVLTPP